MERLNGEVDGFTEWFDFITTDAATTSPFNLSIITRTFIQLFSARNLFK